MFRDSVGPFLFGAFAFRTTFLVLLTPSSAPDDILAGSCNKLAGGNFAVVVFGDAPPRGVVFNELGGVGRRSLMSLGFAPVVEGEGAEEEPAADDDAAATVAIADEEEAEAEDDDAL
jgi:hypothetical protein